MSFRTLGSALQARWLQGVNGTTLTMMTIGLGHAALLKVRMNDRTMITAANPPRNISRSKEEKQPRRPGQDQRLGHP